MTARELIRRRMLVELLDGMSDSDKRLLLLSRDDASDDTRQQLDRIEKKVMSQGFTSDLLANVSGNAIYNILIWAGKALIKNIRI